MAAGSLELWEVVGGRDKGGIVVRQGRDLASPQLERLEAGSVVAQEELVGDRLRYRLLQGAGPAGGWVSLKLKDGKPLLHLLQGAAPIPAPGQSLAHAPVEGRKLRILAVHGTPANSNVIKFQTSPLRTLLRKEAEWLFPDAPLPWAPTDGSTFPSEQPRSESEVRIAQGKPFVQWYRTVVHGADGADDVWEGVAESNDFLERFCEREAPVDVVVAFSQGSSAVSLFVEHLRRKQLKPPWRLMIFFCGGNVDDPASAPQEPCLVPTIYVSGGRLDPFDVFIHASVGRAYPQLRLLEHGDGHSFPSTAPRAGEVYAEVAEAIRRCAGLAPASRPAAALPPAAGGDADDDFPPGMWTVDYIGTARGACKACSRCEYYQWNPNRLRPEMGDDGGATITEWFLNDYDSLRCHACRCAFSDHRSLGAVNKPAGFFPGLSEHDANALLSSGGLTR